MSINLLTYVIESSTDSFNCTFKIKLATEEEARKWVAIMIFERNIKQMGKRGYPKVVS